MNLPALNPVRLRNGTIRYYAWRGRGAPAILAPPGTPEFQAERERLVRARGEPVVNIRIPKTFGELIEFYRDSAAYARVRPSTRMHYDRYLSKIKPVFGDMPLAPWREPEGRIVIKKMMEKWHEAEVEKVHTDNQTGCELDHVVAMLKVVSKFAGSNGIVPADWHPFMETPSIYESKRAEIVWSEEDEVLICTLAKPRWRLALLLAIYTGQRQGDLVRMVFAKSQPPSPDPKRPIPYFDGEFIHVVQSKTGALVDVRVIEPLLSALQAVGYKEGDHLIQTARGHAWRSARVFSSEFASAKNKIPGLSHLHFHDARGTAITRLYEAGVRDPVLLGSITGHTAKSALEVISRHYLGGRQARAEEAMSVWESKISSRVTKKLPN